MDTTTEALPHYRLALDGFDAVVANVPTDRWDAPSACAEWTVRDVVGHAIWGQRQLRAWATGEPDPEPTGAPGSARPGALTGQDPVATWRAARAESEPVLTPAVLTRTTTITGLGAVPLVGVLTLLTTDIVTHTWDIGHALDQDVRLDPTLVPVAFDWARANIVRAPGYFGPELSTPEDADEQTQLLAYLGRAAWQPVPA